MSEFKSEQNKFIDARSADRDFDETVKEIREAIPDMEAGRGRTIEEVERSIRKKLGFAKSS